MSGLEGMGAHGGAQAAAVSGSAEAWRATFWVLAAYFLVHMALVIRARRRGGAASASGAAAEARTARHRRTPRNPTVLSASNVRLAGHVGMGGSMATMLLMMTA
jgi:preprotein translocase subunit SecG